ncbi:hypothetical protein [Spirosoma gilvum]
MLLIYTWRLDTRIDEQGVHYKEVPLFSWRTIPWTDIESVSNG